MSKDTPLRQFFDNIYFNLEGEKGSFSTAYPLLLAAREKDSSISLKQVKEYLKSVRAYQTHRKILRKFYRRSYLSLIPHEFWQCDIAYLAPMWKITKRKRIGNYCLVICDVFSHLGEAVAMATKSAKETLQAFKVGIERLGAIPRMLGTDDGTEYKSVFSQWCKDQNINLYHNPSQTKAVFAENYILRLKSVLFRITTHYRTTKPSDFLAQAVKILNNTPLKSINGLTPNQAVSPEYTSDLQLRNLKKRAKFAKKMEKRRKNSPFKPGDAVRPVVKHFPFSRAYTPRLQNSVHSVESVTRTRPRQFRISGSRSKPYYENELVSIVQREDHGSNEPKILQIESYRLKDQQLLRNGKPRKGSGVKEYLCKLENVAKSKYLTESEILKYINGKQILDDF